MMNENVSKKREYLELSIQTKADEYKTKLGSLYDNLIQMLADLSVEELQELDDLSLFIDYLDYTEALKNRKLSDKLIKESDRDINFSMIVTDDGEAVLDTSVIEEDRESAKEDAWFREHDAGGSLVFEDYDDELEDLEDLDSDEHYNRPSFLDELNGLDDELSGEDKQIDDILKEMSDEDSPIENSFDELSDFLDAINDGMSLEDIEESKKPEYDFFNDWSTDDEEDEDLELLEDIQSNEDDEIETNMEHSKEVDNGFKSNTEKVSEEAINEKLEDPDFKDDYNSKLKEKWGMFKINSPTITLEQMDTFSVSYLSLFINRGFISLPDDLSLIPDEVIDMLMLGGVLNERPEKKEVEDETEEVNEEDLSESFNNRDVDIFDEHEEKIIIESPKYVFQDKKVSERVEALDSFRKKISAFGLSKLKEVNEEIEFPEEEELPSDKFELSEENNEEKVESSGGFFDSIDFSELDDDD